MCVMVIDAIFINAKISVSRSTYSPIVGSSFGQNISSIFPDKNRLWKSAKAHGTQSAAISKSAFRGTTLTDLSTEAGPASDEAMMPRPSGIRRNNTIVHSQFYCP